MAKIAELSPGVIVVLEKCPKCPLPHRPDMDCVTAREHFFSCFPGMRERWSEVAAQMGADFDRILNSIDA